MIAKSVSDKRHRFPTEIIAHAVWLYFRFALRLRGIAKLLRAASRVSAVAISGAHFATIVVPQTEGVCSCVAV